MTTLKWVRETLSDEGSECVDETLEIGPFIIDVYEDGTWEIEGYAEGDSLTTQGKYASMEEAKRLGVDRVLSWMSQWL